MRKNVRITRNVQFIRVAPVLEVQITGNNCLLHDGSLPSTAYRRHKNNCFFSTPRTPTLQKCKEPQVVCTFYLVTINDSYFPDSPMNNIIALLNCSFLVSSCPCYLVVARLETSSSGVTLHCDNLPRDVSLDTPCAGRT